MKGVIISNGNVASKEFYLNQIKDADIVICCDGGANTAYKYGIIPDLILGDFDSISNKILDYYKEKGIQMLSFPANKDKTDTQIAVELLIEKSCNEIAMLSCIGSRFDHSLANISLLYKVLTHKINGYIKDEKNTIYLIDSEMVINAKEGQIVSLIPFTKVVKGINTSGLYYEVKNGSMTFGNPYGVSNFMVKNTAKITIEEGLLLIILSND